MLGNPPDWRRYGQFFLGEDHDARVNTRARFTHPIGRNDGGRVWVYRHAVLDAWRSGDPEIVGAAAELLELIDGHGRNDVDGYRRAYTGEGTFATRSEDSLAFRSADFQVRADEDNDGPFLTGYAALFNVLSEPMWWGFEKIQRGAFAASLARNDDVIANIEHSNGLNVIGRVSNGSLELAEDEVGLRVRIRPPDTQPGRDVVTLVTRRDLRQMSFMFQVRRQELDDTTDELVRTLLEVDLFDVAVVGLPAYSGTSVDANAGDTRTLPRGPFARRLRLIEAVGGCGNRPAGS